MSFINTLILKAAETTSAVEEISSSVNDTTADAIQAIENTAADMVKDANQFIETIEGYIPKIIAFGINVIIAILIFAVGKIIIGFVMKFLKKFFDRTKIELSVKKFLISLCRAVLYIILLIIMCDRVGIDTTSFLAVFASAGLALGLALQGSLSNFAGGVMILLTKPFVVGDYIIDAGTGKEGTVNRVDLFSTHLVTVDNKKVIIPNGNLANSAITNVTAEKKRRVDIAVGISYKANVSEAKKVIEETAKNEELVLKNEEIFVFVQELAESQVTIGLRVWTNSSDYWTVFFNLNEKIKNALDQAGIEIPYNQLDVHIDNN